MESVENGRFHTLLDKTWKKMFSTKKLWKSDVAISQKTNFCEKKSRESRVIFVVTINSGDIFCLQFFLPLKYIEHNIGTPYFL